MKDNNNGNSDDPSDNESNTDSKMPGLQEIARKDINNNTNESDESEDNRSIDDNKEIQKNTQ